MIRLPTAAIAFLFVASPLVTAETPAKSGLSNAQNAQTSETVTARDMSAVQPIDVARPDDNSRPPNWQRINHKINKRAKNAIENGADPARVRHKAQAYKHKLIRRWKASQ